MTGDNEIEDHTLWYDNMLKDLYQKNESPKLATPQQERTKEEIETSGYETVQRTIGPL